MKKKKEDLPTQNQIFKWIFIGIIMIMIPFGVYIRYGEYLKAMDEQRAGTLALLDKLSDEDLEKQAPDNIQKFGATVGAVIAGQSAHWMMHAGQWVIVRRQLGKEAMF